MNIQDTVEEIGVGGIHERSVKSILDGVTKSKTDIWIITTGQQRINVSIKKSRSGQVFLIGVDRFIQGYEKQFACTIPPIVKEAISLFWGSDRARICEVLFRNEQIQAYEGRTQKIRLYEERKCRLVAKSLEVYSRAHSEGLLQWFRENIYNITLFCFSTGLAAEASNHANIVWYINLLEEDDIDEVFLVDKIAEQSQKIAEKHSNSIQYGSSLGGTTIQLPWGFVQWHKGQMQFHHQLEKIRELASKG